MKFILFTCAVIIGVIGFGSILCCAGLILYWLLAAAVTLF